MLSSNNHVKFLRTSHNLMAFDDNGDWDIGDQPTGKVQDQYGFFIADQPKLLEDVLKPNVMHLSAKKNTEYNDDNIYDVQMWQYDDLK